MKKHIFFLVFGLCSLSAAAQNVKGYIRSSNKGVPGVVVSDGDSVTVTDENGYYACSPTSATAMSSTPCRVVTSQRCKTASVRSSGRRSSTR
ncbi:MAG: hypothetical protein II681_01255 [Bacteroidaceae bacterium]|nr:hypothetical protein [Bacteroidaceae bacterium]